ncbi:MAG: hypothetical protein ABI912_11660 [Actinomycetota bacterium]
MAKFLCVCGYSLSTSGLIPDPDEWRCLSDADFDAFSGLVNAEDLYLQSTIMYRCPGERGSMDLLEELRRSARLVRAF